MSRPFPGAGRCIEVKRYPDGRHVTFSCDLLAIEPARQLLGYEIRQPVSVAGVFLPKGTLSYGCFWFGRPYNLYLWVRRCHGRREEIIGAYFNVCDEVELGPYELQWLDLWADVLVLPARRPVTLDRTEIPAGLPPHRTAQIEAVVAMLHARNGELIEECFYWAKAVRKSPVLYRPSQRASST